MKYGSDATRKSAARRKRARRSALKALGREIDARLLASPLTRALLATRGLRTYCTPCHGRGVTL